MTITARLENIATDYRTGRTIITLSAEGQNPEMLARALDADLDVRLEKHKIRRSRATNAYFHVLVGKLSDTLHISKAYAKNLLITRYGQPLLTENGSVRLWETSLDETVVREREDVHAIPTGYTTGPDGTVKNTIYKLYRGSHTYNSREMSALIDGSLSELEEMGVNIDD